MKRIIILCLTLLLSSSLFPQESNSQLKKANELLSNRGEVYFKFQINSPAEIQQLTSRISIDKLEGNTVFAYANSGEFQEFLKRNINFETLPPPASLYPVAVTDDPKQALLWNYYPSYTAYESLMQQFATDHPDICRLITISTLASGRKLLALKITDNPDVQEAEPEFLYTSSIHGDETTGYVLMLHLIDYLLANYPSDPRIAQMINNTEIYINPLSNPDGTYKGGNNSVNGATRGNANNIDLNRNYQDPEDGLHPDGNPWQPETVAFMNFAGFHHFTMSANFHGGEEVINYPWDTWSRLAADNNWWVYVSREYADTVHLHAPSNYMNGFQSGITNGYAWYTISGGRQDYMNYFRNCREVTIEISDTKLLPENQLENHWNYNYRSFLNYLEQCNYGLHGIVTDSLTGAPLRSKVYISGFDLDSSYVYSDQNVGDYHRLLKAGMYNVTFSANGHISKTIPVQITDKQKFNLDVQLYDGSLKANFSSDSQLVPLSSQVQFTDKTVGTPTSWKWEFSGGVPSESSEQNPVITYNEPGIYPVKLVAYRLGEADSVTKSGYIEVRTFYTMQTNSYTVCDALFYDAGGPSANYATGESSVITFTPAAVNSKIKATFISLDIEQSVNCENDQLKIYDGPTTSSALLGSFCGTSLPAVVFSSDASGALTFEFNSNTGVEGSGWEIMLECDSNVGIAETLADEIKLYPNPVGRQGFRIESANIIQSVVVTNICGQEIYRYQPLSNQAILPSPEQNGIYLLIIKTDKGTYSRKLLVNGTSF
ncbi:MAG: T9SS type A sorting domain-containing protein [Bacteroidales bacterium]|nr:T9SS type A sorting domain-containing protein [Bacteroidales bacterium]